MTMKRVCLVLLLAIGVQGVNADELYLQNGDRLSGTILRIDAEQAIIETEYAGEITVAREEIAGFVTDEPVTVMLENGDTLTGRFMPGAEDTLQLQVEPTDALERLDLAEVQAIYQGDPEDFEREATLTKLTGAVNVGLNMKVGNTETETYHADGELRATTLRNRYNLYAEFNRESTDGEETADDALGSFKYDRFLTDRFYLYSGITLERDEFADLDLRTTISAGPGWQILETDDTFFFAEAGVAYVHEDFDMAENDEYFAGRWALDFRQALYVSWAEFFHVQEGLVGEEPDDMVIRSRTGLRFPLSENFVLTAQANIDWDRSPPPGVDSTDREYIFTLGYIY